MAILGIPVSDMGFQETLELIQAWAKSDGRHQVVTLNPEMVVEARKNSKAKKVLQASDLVTPDGIGIIFSSWLLGKRITKGRVTGLSLAEKLIAESYTKGYSVYLLGSSSKMILNKTTHNLVSTYGKINIVGASTGPAFSSAQSTTLETHDNLAVVEEINKVQPNILLVGFGHPKQELWIAHHLPQLKVQVAIGVGGVFDYLSGAAQVAPKVFSYLGLEWLWRLLNNPKRFFRILNAVVIFPMLVLVEVIKKMFHIEHPSTT